MGGLHSVGVLLTSLLPEHVHLEPRNGGGFDVQISQLPDARISTALPTMSRRGPLALMSPEMYMGVAGADGQKADVFAVGACILSMVCPPGLAIRSLRKEAVKRRLAEHGVDDDGVGTWPLFLSPGIFGCR